MVSDSDSNGECSLIEVKETLGSIDLEVGSVFKTKGDNDGLSYVYIGCHNFYNFSEIDNTIFTTHVQECEDMVHLFYCRERNEYTKFRWANAELEEQKVSDRELNEILNRFHYSPIGTKIKDAEFHVNHLNFNTVDRPINSYTSQVELFTHSFFKEINRNDKIFLVIEWDKSTVNNNYIKFNPHIIRIIDNKEKFTFDYIPKEHWEKFKGFLDLDKIKENIKSVEIITNKRPSLFAIFSKSLKEKFYQEKIEDFKKMKLGALYLIYEKIKK